MDPASIIAIVVGVVALLSFLVAYLQYKENHSDRVSSKLGATVKTLVSEQTKPLDDKLTDHTVRLGQAGDRLNRIENLLEDIAGQNRAFSDQMARMGVKVDMYWTSLEALAMNSAKSLHQPDPRRHHIDKLLEAFMEGTLTPEERIELKKVLVVMRNYEPAHPVPLDFPIYPGDQSFATILLSTMDLVDPARMSLLGHATHRNHVVTLDPGASNE